MSAPRTPGPWAYLDIGEIASTDPVDNYPTDDVICVVAGPEHPNADGNLIASAPALYDGCNAMLGLVQLILGRDDLPAELREVLTTNHRIAEAEAATAKARGEAA